MRSLGLAVASAALLLAACAKDPDYGFGIGGSNGGGGSGGSAGSYTPPALKLSHSNVIISHSTQIFSTPTNSTTIINNTYHNNDWNADSPTTTAPAWVAIKLAPGPTRIL